MGENQIDKLIAVFANAAKEHYAAIMRGDWREANKQAKRLSNAFHEITAIGERARREFLALVDSEDLAIATAAAVYSLKFNTERSKAALQRIATEPGMIGFRAQQALQRWDEGAWQLE
jgi:hypothetical protein